jgi:hypothetical protein
MRPEPRRVQGSPALHVVQGGLRINGKDNTTPIFFEYFIISAPSAVYDHFFYEVFIRVDPCLSVFIRVPFDLLYLGFLKYKICVHLCFSVSNSFFFLGQWGEFGK